MVSSLLWVIGLALESVLLVRAVVGNFLNHYIFFYLYLLSVFLRSASLLGIYHFWPNLYRSVYWDSQFLNVLLGCALVWEVYKIALSRYPGAARMARNVLPFLFIFAITRVFVKAWNSPNWMPGRTALETERDLRIVQGVLLLSLIGLFIYYAIPLGRNLKGIVGGYSLFVVTSIVHLTLRNSLGDSFQHLWQYIQPISYAFVLFVWCVTLWSYAPNPKPETEPQLQEDYESLVRATRRHLNLARTYLHRGMRP